MLESLFTHKLKPILYVVIFGQHFHQSRSRKCLSVRMDYHVAKVYIELYVGMKPRRSS
jgi:hypothetical protein